jgi:hypothetical protein
MAMPLYITKEEITGMSATDLAREAEEELATTRKLQNIESGTRSRKLERDEVKERFAIGVVPLVEHEDYAVLAAKHLRIGTRRAELDRELRETITALARGMAAYNKHRVEHQAQAVIDGVDGNTFQGFEEMRSRQVRLENEVSIHSQALRQLWPEMETIKSERSIDAAESARPAHTKVVGVIADACATLLKALRDEALIREVVTDAGFDSRLPIFQGIKDIAELESRAREYAQ